MIIHCCDTFTFFSTCHRARVKYLTLKSTLCLPNLHRYRTMTRVQCTLLLGYSRKCRQNTTNSFLSKWISRFVWQCREVFVKKKNVLFKYVFCVINVEWKKKNNATTAWMRVRFCSVFDFQLIFLYFNRLVSKTWPRTPNKLKIFVKWHLKSLRKWI